MKLEKVKLEKLKKCSFLMVLAAVSASPLTSHAHGKPTWHCGHRHPGYAIQTFRDYEAQVQLWNSRMNSAPYGSIEARAARDQLQLNADRAVNVIATEHVLRGYTSSEVESLALDLNQKKDNSPYGSLIQDFYQRSMTLAFEEYVRNSQHELSCYGSTEYFASVHVGDAATQKHDAAPYASLKQTSYKRVAQAAWRTGIKQIQALGVAPSVTYAELETHAIHFQTRYNAAPYASDSQKFFREVSDSCQNSSLVKFQAASRYTATSTLYRLLEEYAQKGRSAPYASSYASYCQQMSQAAQTELSYRSTPGRRVECTITTVRSRYEGFGYSESEALRSARLSCERFERVQSCYSASYFCR